MSLETSLPLHQLAQNFKNSPSLKFMTYQGIKVSVQK